MEGNGLEGGNRGNEYANPRSASRDIWKEVRYFTRAHGCDGGECEHGDRGMRDVYCVTMRKGRLVHGRVAVVYTGIFYKSKCLEGDSNDMQSRGTGERDVCVWDKQVSGRRRPREPPNVADWRRPEVNMCQRNEEREPIGDVTIS